MAIVHSVCYVNSNSENVNVNVWCAVHDPGRNTCDFQYCFLAEIHTRLSPIHSLDSVTFCAVNWGTLLPLRSLTPHIVSRQCVEEML